MLSNKDVSIIVPAYNSARYINCSLRSGLEQDLSNIEVIVCDDSSTDNTSSIIENIADSRIQLLRNVANLGPGASRDRAIAASVGRWIALLDADDVWKPERLSGLLHAASITGADVVFDDLMLCHNTGNGLKPWRPLHGRRAFGNNGRIGLIKIENYIRSERLMIQPMIRSSFISQHRIVHNTLRFAEDADFILRLAHAGARFCYVPAPTYLYRITPNSLTAQAKDPALMRQVIEKCAQWPGWSPPMLEAFSSKITKLERNEQLYALRAAAKNMQLGAALQLLLTSPSLCVDALKRLPSQLAYQWSRLYHSGTGR